MLKIHPEANKDLHFEFEARDKGKEPKELEIYVGGWFLCSVAIKDLSEEAYNYIFDENAIY